MSWLGGWFARATTAPEGQAALNGLPCTCGGGSSRGITLSRERGGPDGCMWWHSARQLVKWQGCWVDGGSSRSYTGVTLGNGAGQMDMCVANSARQLAKQ